MQVFSEEDKDFIQKHLTENCTNLTLKYQKDTHKRDLVEQIAARQKIKSKLPNWYKNFNLHFPIKISLEQCSSEATASYKAQNIGGDTLLDLTGGFGVDFSSMSKRFTQAIYVEQNAKLAEIVKSNLGFLGLENTLVCNQEADEFLNQNQKQFTWVYLDPARRDNHNQKVTLLQDCTPNIIEIQSKLFEITNNILLKCAPMLDITLAAKQLQHVKKVSIVELNGEVKELLFWIEKGFTDSYLLETVHIDSKNTSFIQFEPYLEKEIVSVIDSPKKYLYDPSAALLKSGFFKQIGSKFNLKKLHTNTHLYTSDTLNIEFTGRIFEIEHICKIESKTIKQALGSNKANINCRNVPFSVAEIQKKLSLIPGGKKFIYFTTDCLNQKIALICNKNSRNEK